MGHNFKQLKVWQIAMDHVVKIYNEAQCLPEKEKFGLYAQLTRSAVSIASNIAEGSGRKTDKDFGNFLNMALASAFENETQIMICERINYFDEKITEGLLNSVVEIQRMLNGLISKLNNDNK